MFFFQFRLFRDKIIFRSSWAQVGFDEKVRRYENILNGRSWFVFDMLVSENVQFRIQSVVKCTTPDSHWSKKSDKALRVLNVDIWKKDSWKWKASKIFGKVVSFCIFVHLPKRFETKRYEVSLLLCFFVRILYAFFRLHCRHELSKD